ncbi:sensor histidine kinase [Cellulomonas sp. HZM]|uniref:sensor histidine kinase n=1 Tax=Cellulomonas sp. HZM TaxID=1454010 RepID=UPI000554DC83|nr:histidine kinase [Cellulomonas sp. HZM]
MTTYESLDCPPRAVPRVVAVPVALGLLLLTGLAAWAPGAHGEASVPLVVDALAGALALVALALVTRAPVAAGLALGALAALSPAATPAATAGTLVAARWFRARTSLVVGGASVLGHGVQGLWRDPGVPYGWWLLCDVAVHAALVGWGAYSRSRATAVALWRDRAQQAQAEQRARVEEARLAERTRIAREMHDSLAHRLSLLATTAGALEYRPDAAPEQVARAVGVVRAQASGALEDLRTVVGLLRSGDEDDDAGLDPAGLVGAVVDAWREAGVDVELDAPGLADLPDGPVGLAVYRVVQEGLTNAHRHSAGADVRVLVRADGRDVTVEVGCAPGAGGAGRAGRAGRADGVGGVDGVAGGPGATGAASPGAGVGLVGLRERVEMLGGSLDAGPGADGFVLTARVPR